MSLPPVIPLSSKLALVSERWAPKIIAQTDSSQFKVVKIKGEFIWHKHTDTDEVFLVLAGSMRIDFRDGSRTLTHGDMLVVPAGLEHRPAAEVDCALLLIERPGTINTGETGGDRTAPEEWI